MTIIKSRMKRTIVLNVLILLCSLESWAQTDIVIGKEFTIQSRILKEERSYVVRLPASYENDDLYIKKRYPVLILLDADSHFFPVSGLIHAMSVNDEQIPEMIVVAIRNTNRARDMMPNPIYNKSDSAGDVGFLRFIELELLKEIENRYRTLPFRLLAGHSLAGLFAISCFLQQNSFNAYIAIDPSLRWSNQSVVKKAKTVLTENKTLHSILYVAESDNPFRDRERINEKHETFKQFEGYLAGNKSAGLSYECDYFEDEDHFSIPSYGFYRGLLFVFDGFKIPLNTLGSRRTSDILEHYRKFQTRMGAAIPPPGKLIDQVGLFYLNEKKVDQAIDFLKVNEIHYSNSFVTYQSLGDAFKAKGNIEMAVQYYKKSLTLNPGNSKAKKSIDELTH